MRSDKPDTNTDPEYHRGLTNDQLKYELDYLSNPFKAAEYDRASVKQRIRLIKQILKERDV